jgi:hypothetical protein
VDVHPFDRIRVVAFVGGASAFPVDITLTITEDAGGGLGEAVALLDELNLQPGDDITRVYEVPGTQLRVFAEIQSGSGFGTSKVGVLIYGSGG